MTRNYRIFLEDILAAMEAIERFVENMSLEEFRQDDKTASAVIRKFEIIGEAAKHIPPHLRRAYPDIPWKEMAGLRDRLIHGYFGIDYALFFKQSKCTSRRSNPSLRLCWNS